MVWGFFSVEVSLQDERIHAVQSQMMCDNESR
jgi:hypothetical protein